MNNCQVVKVGTFRDILSDSPIATNKSDESVRENTEKTDLKEASLAVKHTFSDKKKNKAQAMASRFVAKSFSSSKVPM